MAKSLNMNYTELKKALYNRLIFNSKRNMLIKHYNASESEAYDIAGMSADRFWAELESKNIISEKYTEIRNWPGCVSDILIKFYKSKKTDKSTFEEDLRQFINPIATLSETSFSLLYDRLRALGAESINDLKLLTEQDVIDLQILKLLQVRKFIVAVKELK